MIQLLFGWLRDRLAERRYKKTNAPVAEIAVEHPRRYAFSSHQIPASAFSPATCEVLRTLRRSGFEAYVVGGAVRDLLLGFTPKDFDVATNATPEQVKSCFRRAFIIGRRFRLVHVSLHRETIEVSTFRGAANTADSAGRLISDNVYGSQEDDAARRDFSANALYYDIETQEIIDYHSGVEAIQLRCLRLIGDPEQRYREDPVRMLRAIRLASKLGLALEPLTAAPIAELAVLLEAIPKARLLDELEKIFNTGYSAYAFAVLRQYGVLHYLWTSLDKVLEDQGVAKFINAVLSETDARQRQEKSISIAFIFSALLWPLLCKRLKGKLEHQRIDEFFAEIERFLEYECADSLAIPRRHTSIIKEIWQLQLRFYQRLGGRPHRLLSHPRFRAGLDFLALRARGGEIDAKMADWWQAFYSGDVAKREALQEQLAAPVPEQKESRRRPRRKRPSKTADESAQKTIEAADAGIEHKEG